MADRNDASATGRLTREGALAALSWLVEMGADEATAADPTDWFAQPASPPPQAAVAERGPADRAERQPQAKPGVIRSPELAVQDARAMAAACDDLAGLEEALRNFDACPLSRTATNLCFSDGNPQARVMFIGEAPGRDEDLQGKPFVGRSGQLLDKMLGAIGLSRASEEPANAAFISNMIFWRPPGNRKPTEAETMMCMPFLRRAIELAEPEIIVCLGATPTQRLIGRTEGILKLRGRWMNLQSGERQIPLLATLHPAYLLRQPAQKRLSWRDFLDLQSKLEAG